METVWLQMTFWNLAIQEVLRKPEKFKTFKDAVSEVYRIVPFYTEGRRHLDVVMGGADLFNLDKIFAHLEKS